MGRNKLSPRRLVSLRIPEELYAELILLRPDLQDVNGYVKYGAQSGYFMQLLREDLEKRKQQLRARYDHATHAA
jgi:hypothetical protein